MSKQDVIKIKKNHLIILGIIFVGVVLFFLISNNSIKTVTANVVNPAQYDYLEEVKGKQKYTFEINEGGYELLSGINTVVYSYNDQIPGPLIKGKVGDIIQVNVKNNLNEPTTIHWHGLILDNVQDGVPQVTQEPVLPGKKFSYDIELRNAGLYWYHSHVEAHKQVESGLYGIILVEDKEKDMDEGNILVLDDVLLGLDYQFRDFNLGVMHGRFGNHFLVNGEVNPQLSLNNNRLRIVNAANARSFNLNFGNKPFTVIGMDIGESDGYQDSILTIHPGERYDILLDINEGEKITLNHMTSRRVYNLGQLSMDGNKIETLTTDFTPPFLIDDMLNKEPDFNADLYGYRGGHMGIIWSINEKYFPETTEIFNVNEGDIVKIRLKNLQGQPHPMHLHGQKFIVLARNGQVEENLGWKDTTMVGNREEVDIIFIAEEKGDWVFHCHILEHAEAGMLSIVRVN